VTISYTDAFADYLGVDKYGVQLVAAFIIKVLFMLALKNNLIFILKLDF
jgi:hypothetical protein